MVMAENLNNIEEPRDDECIIEFAKNLVRPIAIVTYIEPTVWAIDGLPYYKRPPNL